MYTVRENPPENIQENLKKYDPLTQRMLYAGGITSSKEAESFFKKEWNDIDAYQYRDMEKAVQRIIAAIVNKETIGIYSDYDCDGIPAAAALHTTLNAFGHKAITYYVPDRNTQGFGLNSEGIRKMRENNVSVMNVLDCGTAEPERINEIQQAGIDVIILDHHLPGEKTPEAFALINPAVEKGIEPPHPCAAGVVYGFIQAIIQQAQEMPIEKKPRPGWEKWQLDIIALATLSDMVPMHGINRQLTHYGIHVIKKSPRPGIKALCELLRIQQQKLTQDDLAFMIIPRINAASRMGDARTAFELLTTDSIEAAKRCVKKLTNLNNKRKTTVASMVKKANKQAETKKANKEVWVFGDRQWKPSLAGLVAQKLSETYEKTVFVWGQGGDESKTVIKGSCRSKKHDTFKMMQEAKDMFTESGGHKQAGGFTLVKGGELQLEDRLNETSSAKETKAEIYQIDGECQISDIPTMLDVCKKFSPFGEKNEQVHIALPKCQVKKVEQFGKNKEHMRYIFSDETGDVHGVSFFAKKENDAEKTKERQTVIGPVEWDTFLNKPRIRVLKLLS